GQDHQANQLVSQHLYVGGQHHTIEEAVEALRPHVARSVGEMTRINQECADIKRATNRAHSCGGTGSLGFNNFGIASGVLDHPRNTNILKFDRMSVREYFDNKDPMNGLGISKDHWLYGYLEAAYTTEYGIPL